MLSTSEFLAISNSFNKFYSMRINAVAADYGLSKVEMDVLLFLYNNPQFDTARDIVEYRHIAKSYVSKAVDLLVKKRALFMTEDAKDRRVVHLKISEDSLSAAMQARAAQKKIMEELFWGLTKEEQAIFGNIMQKIAKNIEEGNMPN